MTFKQQIKKFDTDNIETILTELELDESLHAQMNSLESDVEIFNYFQEAKQYENAIKYLALGMPKREAIWWAYICSEALEKESDDTKTIDALSAAEAWVKSPSDDKRRKAGALGAALEFYTPASWAATAVFWSGGSITPDGRPEVEASAEMCAEAVYNAITISARKMEGETDDVFVLFLKRGLHIAMGGNGRIEYD